MRSESPICQINTKRICLKIVSSREKKQEKKGIGLDIKFLNIRVFEVGKIDILLRDICLNCLQTENNEGQVLRIADESYLLFEMKNINEKFILLKNVYLRCKLLDIHLTKQFLHSVLYFYKFIKEHGQPHLNIDNKDRKILNYR